AAPEEHAGLRFEPGLDADGAKTVGRFEPGAGKAGAKGLYRLAIAAITEPGQDEFGIQPPAAKGRGDLEVGKPLDPFGLRRDEAAARGGREGLGETADIDDALQPVEGRKPRRRALFEIVEDVVLD